MPETHLLYSYTRHQGVLEKWYRGQLIPFCLGLKWRTKCMQHFFWDGGSKKREWPVMDYASPKVNSLGWPKIVPKTNFPKLLLSVDHCSTRACYSLSCTPLLRCFKMKKTTRVGTMSKWLLRVSIIGNWKKENHSLRAFWENWGSIYVVNSLHKRSEIEFFCICWFSPRRLSPSKTTIKQLM